METLASLFVVLVTTTNSIAPQANIPQVLGVQIANETTNTTTNVSIEGSASGRNTQEIKNRIDDVLKQRKALEVDFKARRQLLEDEIRRKREEFKSKIATIKDERKKQVVNNLDQNISSRNSKWVEHWNKFLVKLTEILGKIKTRTDEAAAKGKDVTLVRTAISAAEKAIADAQALVNAQSGKTYVFNISSEETLSSDVRSTVTQFKSDVQSVMTLMNTARKAVNDVYGVLKTVVGENHEPKRNPSPTP